MVKLRTLAFLCSLFVTTIFLTGCPSQTTVARINGDPGRYQNKEVAIAGRVTDSYGVPGAGAYEVDDGTGKIWVVTKRAVPSRGSRVGAKGYVHTAFSFGGRSYGTVVEETDRKTTGR